MPPSTTTSTSSATSPPAPRSVSSEAQHSRFGEERPRPNQESGSRAPLSSSKRVNLTIPARCCASMRSPCGVRRMSRWVLMVCPASIRNLIRLIQPQPCAAPSPRSPLMPMPISARSPPCAAAGNELFRQSALPFYASWAGSCRIGRPPSPPIHRAGGRPRALSRCRRPVRERETSCPHAATPTASRHVAKAAARSSRFEAAEMRWRQVLNVL